MADPLILQDLNLFAEFLDVFFGLEYLLLEVLVGLIQRVVFLLELIDLELVVELQLFGLLELALDFGNFLFFRTRIALPVKSVSKCCSLICC